MLTFTWELQLKLIRFLKKKLRNNKHMWEDVKINGDAEFKVMQICVKFYSVRINKANTNTWAVVIVW